MLAAISSASGQYAVNLATMRFASRVNGLLSQPSLKEGRLDIMLRDLNDEAQRLLLRLKQDRLDMRRSNIELTQHQQTKSRNLLLQRVEARKRARLLEQQREEAKVRRANMPKLHRQDSVQLEPEIREVKVIKKVIKEVTREEEVVREINIGPTDEDLAATRVIGQSAEKERNAVGLAMEAADARRQEEERERKELETQFKSLQMKVIGLATADVVEQDTNAFEMDPTVIIARQQAKMRKAQFRLKEKQKKQAKLEAARRQMDKKKRRMQEELARLAGDTKDFQKHFDNIKAGLQARVGAIQAEARERKEAHEAEVDALQNDIERRVTDLLLLNTLVSEFLTDSELKRIRSKSALPPNSNTWRLPHLVAKKLRFNSLNATMSSNDSFTSEPRSPGPPPDPKKTAKRISKYFRSCSKIVGGFAELEQQLLHAADAIQVMNEGEAMTHIQICIKLCKRHTKGTTPSRNLPKQINILFDQLDRNRDGRVDEKEVRHFFKKVVAKGKYRALSAKFLKRFDANEDHVVTREEFRSGVAALGDGAGVWVEEQLAAFKDWRRARKSGTSAANSASKAERHSTNTERKSRSRAKRAKEPIPEPLPEPAPAPVQTSQNDEIAKLFNMIDKDRSGKVDLKELKLYLRKIEGESKLTSRKHAQNLLRIFAGAEHKGKRFTLEQFQEHARDASEWMEHQLVRIRGADVVHDEISEEFHEEVSA